MSTVVLYCWCHSDSASVLLYFTLLPNFGGFHRTLQRVRLAKRGRLLLRTPGPVAFVLMLRPFFPELVMSTELSSFEHPSVLLFCFVAHLSCCREKDKVNVQC